MEMRRLGKTGLSVAPIVIGGNVFGWTADEKTSFAILDRVAAETGARPAEISLAWLLRKTCVTAPIASATSQSQLESLLKSATLSLSNDAMALLDEAGAERTEP